MSVGTHKHSVGKWLCGHGAEWRLHLGETFGCHQWDCLIFPVQLLDQCFFAQGSDFHLPVTDCIPFILPDQHTSPFAHFVPNIRMLSCMDCIKAFLFSGFWMPLTLTKYSSFWQAVLSCSYSKSAAFWQQLPYLVLSNLEILSALHWYSTLPYPFLHLYK